MTSAQKLWMGCLFGLACLSPTLVHAQASANIAEPFALGLTPAEFANLLAPPPADHTPAAELDLAAVHRAEASRTSAQVQAAQADDKHEDIFLYNDVLGPVFVAEHLPQTAALSARLRKTAGSIDNPLKTEFHKLRPYNFDPTLHPVCETNKEFTYPSGHAVNGYLYAFTLAEILPEKRDELLRRADAYAHNRVVCGVHYPGDVEASRRIALIAFGALLSKAEFLQAFHLAESETRAALHLGTIVEATSPSHR